MPINKERCGPAGGNVAGPKGPKASGPQQFDGAKNIDAGSEIMERPSWQGPGTVVETE